MSFDDWEGMSGIKPKRVSLLSAKGDRSSMSDSDVSHCGLSIREPGQSALDNGLKNGQMRT